MANEFAAVFERDGEWHNAYCPEIPGANGQGKTKDEARASLAEAIALIKIKAESGDLMPHVKFPRALWAFLACRWPPH
jgi:predicted RNase H-like HicB family nuclease